METITLTDTAGNRRTYQPDDIIWFFEEADPGLVRIVDKERNADTFRLTPRQVQTLKAQLRASGTPIWFGAFQGESLGLPGLPNTRGLGGLAAADDSVIARHRLIRSGALHGATAEDIAYLTGTMGLKTIVDLRTDLEIAAKPDPRIPGVKWIHVPLLDTRAYEAIGLRTLSESGLLEMGRKGPEMMKALYRRIVGWPEGIAGLKRFFSILLDQPDGAVLWHCTQGKDRTGVTAAILERLLGCTPEVIEHDYLQTNPCLNPEKDATEAWLEKKLGMKPATVQDFSFLFEAEPSFLQAAWDVIDEEFGGFNAYVANELGLQPAQIAKLRQMYTI